MRGPAWSRKLIVAQGRREQMPVVLAAPNGGYSRLNGLAAQLMSLRWVTSPTFGRGVCLVAGRSGTDG